MVPEGFSLGPICFWGFFSFLFVLLKRSNRTKHIYDGTEARHLRKVIPS